MHATVTRDDKDFVNPGYQNLLTAFMKNDFLSCGSNAVAIQYFEVWVKYASYFVQAPQFIPSILENLLSEKGVLHKSAKVASRSSYFALRFIDRLKAQLTSWAELLFERSKEIIKMAENGQTHLSPCDLENFYEIVGSVMANFNMDATHISSTLQHYFELLCTKINSYQSGAVENVVGDVRKLWAIIKPLNTKTAEPWKDLFIAVWETLHPVLHQNLKYRTLRDSIAVFVQKSMFGSSTIGVFDKYLEMMIGAEDIEWLDTGMRLAAFAIVEMGDDALQVIDKYIPIILNQVQTKVQFPESDKSDTDKDALNVFSKLMKLLGQCWQRNCWLLLAPNTITVFEPILKLLMFMVKQSVNKQLRKDALQILRTVLTEFSGCTLAQIKQVHTGDKDKIEDRKISDNAEYESVWKYLWEVVSKEMFEVFGYLNPSDPVDVNSIYLVMLIHVILVNADSTFASTYESNIKMIKPDINFSELASTMQMFMEGKLKPPIFKRNIIKIFKAK